MKWFYIHLSFLCIIYLYSCDSIANNDDNGELIAEAYQQKLHKRDVEPYLVNASTALDSQFVISRFVDEWLMDIILIEEAKKKIKNRTKIQELVKKYEQSLIINELESMYLKNELDTVIQTEEIDSFFNFHKEDFLLQDPIVRFLFIKLPESSINDTFAQIWETEDLPALREYVKLNNGVSILEAGEWQFLTSLKNITPTSLFNKISLNKPNVYSFEENDQHFYLKILEIINEKDSPPVEFVKDRIQMRILQNRIKALLKAKRNQLFSDRIASKEIKIYDKKNK